MADFNAAAFNVDPADRNLHNVRTWRSVTTATLHVGKGCDYYRRNF